jgi:hypothetical protein
MRSRHEHNATLDDKSNRELTLLSEVQRTPETNQRDLSERTGIALGMTNFLLRNLARKGYLRITQAGWRRWLYVLTPTGFSRKVQLTSAYIRRTLGHYQKVRETLREELVLLGLHVESRVAVYGTGEFAELVYLGIRQFGIEEIDFYTSDGPEGEKFLGMPVRNVGTLDPGQYDRVIVAFLSGQEESCVELIALGVTSKQLVTFFSDALPSTGEDALEVETEQWLSDSATKYGQGE